MSRDEDKKIKFIDGNMIEYEILKLVDFYDPILRQPTQAIDFEQTHGHIVAYRALSLMETLNKLEGLGLSANQVGLPYRMCAINMGQQIWCMINPKIVWKSEEKSSYKEGCLSYQGLYLEIGRAVSIKIEFQAANGQVIEEKFDGLTATVIQHELDHLDGIMFTDLVSPIKLNMAKRKIKTNLKKMRRMTSAA